MFYLFSCRPWRLTDIRIGRECADQDFCKFLSSSYRCRVMQSQAQAHMWRHKTSTNSDWQLWLMNQTQVTHCSLRCVPNKGWWSKFLFFKCFLQTWLRIPFENVGNLNSSVAMFVVMYCKGQMWKSLYFNKDKTP